MPLEDLSEEDLVIVQAARKVAIAFGRALGATVKQGAYTINEGSIDSAWISFADELCEFVNLVED